MASTSTRLFYRLTSSFKYIAAVHLYHSILGSKTESLACNILELFRLATRRSPMYLEIHSILEAIVFVHVVRQASFVVLAKKMV